jgi:hypothetical protein
MKNCVECGKGLSLGGFAYNQDTCFDCFKKKVDLISEIVDKCPLAYQNKRRELKEVLDWMGSLVAEVYGHEW